MTAPTDPDLQAAVITELDALAAALEATSPTSWDQPSLCAGWRVRDVVAHMTMAARYDHAAFEAELRASNFDFTELSDRIALRDSAAPIASLLADLRSDALRQWAPPGGGFAGALNHAVIHSLDITTPLGIARMSSDATMRVVLDGLAAGGVHAHFGTSIDGVELRATDLGWSYGTGPTTAAPAHVLALAMCGRAVPDVSLMLTVSRNPSDSSER
jgi:uncharacterized protein (TIGR03083 family)